MKDIMNLHAHPPDVVVCSQSLSQVVETLSSLSRRDHQQLPSGFQASPAGRHDLQEHVPRSGSFQNEG